MRDDMESIAKQKRQSEPSNAAFERIYLQLANLQGLVEHSRPNPTQLINKCQFLGEELRKAQKEKQLLVDECNGLHFELRNLRRELAQERQAPQASSG